MAESDIVSLHGILPEVFEDRLPTSDDWSDLIFVDITSPGAPHGDSELSLPEDESQVIDRAFFNSNLTEDEIRAGFSATAESLAGRLPGGHPGALISSKATLVPPAPDCLAFYLPYHHFYPEWWGVYLILDGIALLAKWIESEAAHRGYTVTARDCWIGARLFLFYHEICHHNVESFATRLEVTHRQPLYKSGFNAFYSRTAGTSACLEESLAEANAWRQTTNFPRFYSSGSLSGVKAVLRDYIRLSPPGYAEGVNYLTAAKFTRGQNEFAEKNHQTSVSPPPPGKNVTIWNSAKYLFRGFNDKAKGRAKYIISKHSPLAARLPLRPRLNPDGVKRRLRAQGCVFVRQGSNHEQWQCPGTKRLIPISRHPGDLSNQILKQIIKEAGLEMSIEEFVAIG